MKANPDLWAVAREPREPHQSDTNRIPYPATDNHQASAQSQGPSPWVKPSLTFHAVCAYWLTSSEGFSAKAQAQHASTMEDSVALSTIGCRTFPPKTPNAQHLIALCLLVFDA